MIVLCLLMRHQEACMRVRTITEEGYARSTSDRGDIRGPKVPKYYSCFQFRRRQQAKPKKCGTRDG